MCQVRKPFRRRWRITYLCSRSCERSEQFARSSDPARALLIFQNPRASGRANKWSEAECFARGTSGRAPEAACPPRSGVATRSYAKAAHQSQVKSKFRIISAQCLHLYLYIAGFPPGTYCSKNAAQSLGGNRFSFRKESRVVAGRSRRSCLDASP